MKSKTDTVAEPEADQTSAYTILVVDDEEQARTMFFNILAHADFNVVTASSVLEACEIVRTQKLDLVLLDWNLLGGTETPGDPSFGSEVLRVCREVDMKLPVVVITQDYTTIDVENESLSNLADSFIRKPLQAGTLLSHCRFLLERRRRSSSILHLASEQDIVSMDELKYLYVRSVVALLDGNLSETARRLGINRNTVKNILTGVGESNS